MTTFYSKHIKYFLIISIILAISCQNKSDIGDDRIREYVNSKDSIVSTKPLDENLNTLKPELTYLLDYNGKYEFESKLFNREPLKARLKNILGENYNVLTDCTTQIPIEVKNGIVIFQGWLHHFPEESNYAIYIDINANKIYVGVWDGGKDITELYSENAQNYHKWLIEWKEETEKSYSTKNNESLNNTETIKESFKIGDEVQLGYFKYRVDNIEYQQEVSNGLNSFKSSGTILIVHLTITNLDRESSTLTNSMFKVYDSDNYEFDTSQDAMIVMILKDQDKIFMLKEFQPKIPKKIIIPFEVPTSNDIYTLEVSGGFGTGQKSLIRLTN